MVTAKRPQDYVDGQLSRLLVKRNKWYNHVDKGIRYATMVDWMQKQLTKEWTVYYFPEEKKDIETWLMEHTVDGCGGTVSYEQEPKQCSLCKTAVPSKLMLAITMLLKKDLIRV